MANARDILRRIRSVKGTQQITKAMKMVAAAKLRRAQERIAKARPYADTLSRVLASLAERTEHTHPLLEQREGNRAWLVVITSDKGLCGAFSHNLLREADELLASDRWENPAVVAVGRKAAEHYRKRSWELVHEEPTMISNLKADDGPRLARLLMDAFDEGRTDSIWLLYNSFVSMMRQERTLVRLLPVEPPPGDEAAGPEVDYLYEPDAKTLLGELLPRHVETQVQTAVFDSIAAEHAARMTAMEMATKNATEMIDKLTLLYNRTRQAAITKELIEIVSGAQALEQ
ncbi:MAG: ATP synthase F1 subunit gamma [Acidobacteria bacterium]|nr:ATP synthase F1 subunit gamma [Acidobacteriota bacterium]